MTKLILWDVDGTLIHGGGVAGAAMRVAMERIYGRPTDQERRSYAGKTDQQIVLETFPHLPPEALLDDIARFTEAYYAELSSQQEAFRARAYVLDGVVPVLEHLAAGEHVQALLTGNLRPVAQLKLDLLGIAHFFDFDSGAFGSDHHRRRALVPIAAGRAAARHGRPFAGREVVVVGDTPNDIDCGRAFGARTVAVATGPFGLDELRAQDPDAALMTLADTDAVLDAILGC